KPNLLIGDHILVNKFIYGIKNPFTGSTLISIEKPERGEVVVFIYPVDRDKDFIKRVVGIEGDRVQIINKKVYVNGQPMPDNHTMHTDGEVLSSAIGGPRDNFGPYIVPANSIFVMGDNRDQSYDSRFWGPVNLKDVKGKAFIVYWSWDSENFGVRWKRFGKTIH
ncbi:MAG: signal peptidase I, partial [Deltaproteobacteria bacterium]|nr:signal peptidase I [Deltaproteobacteria bacterium]